MKFLLQDTIRNHFVSFYRCKGKLYTIMRVIEKSIFYNVKLISFLNERIILTLSYWFQLLLAERAIGIEEYLFIVKKKPCTLVWLFSLNVCNSTLKGIFEFWTSHVCCKLNFLIIGIPRQKTCTWFWNGLIFVFENWIYATAEISALSLCLNMLKVVAGWKKCWRLIQKHKEQ